ncbi:TRAP transporter small permease [Desulfatiglans anilini]|uniref:TRAP transporter small permease n=1 Tax=Desulfatiglans anilini TaxID=90728 RepID=UPI000411D115|nr:TRAP transporter small permease [Desulfatiglans anilini]
MDFLDKMSRVLNRGLIWIGGLFLAAMILLTCANIFLRIVWVPVQGAYELMGYFGAIAGAFALGSTQIRRGHISVDVLYNSFPAGVRRGLTFLNSLLCLVFFCMAAWQITRYGNTLWRTGEVTETLRIPYFPFIYGMALGCGALALVFLVDLLRTLFPREEGQK